MWTPQKPNAKHKNGHYNRCADKGTKINLSDSAEKHSKTKLVRETANSILKKEPAMMSTRRPSSVMK